MSNLADLKTLRDEIRVDLHLAGMDLRDEWKILEGKLPDAATLASDLKQAVESVVTELKDFRDRLRAGGASPDL